MIKKIVHQLYSRLSRLIKLLPFYNYLEYKKKKSRYKRILATLKKKKRVNVILHMYGADLWKLDCVYNELLNSSKFEPYVLIAPMTNRPIDYIKKSLTECVSYCKIKKYNYLVGIDEKGETTGVKNNIIFDVILFTNPNNFTSVDYKLRNNANSLSCYIPYSVRVDKLYQYSYNNSFVNSMWTHFLESDIHKSLAEKYSDVKGNNCVVTGHPQLDFFKSQVNHYRPMKKSNKLHIVWAPHWTIPNIMNDKKAPLNWGTFDIYYEAFLSIASLFSNVLRFTLKPHPSLFYRMSNSDKYGQQFTENFKKKWQVLDNCTIHEGNYEDLFLDSDALIHDSGSFSVEYLQLDKPVAYLYNPECGEKIVDRFNPYGEKAIEAHSLISSEEELLEFIHSIIAGIDKRKKDRKKFIRKYLDSNKLASKNIADYIENQLS